MNSEDMIVYLTLFDSIGGYWSHCCGHSRNRIALNYDCTNRDYWNCPGNLRIALKGQFFT